MVWTLDSIMFLHNMILLKITSIKENSFKFGIVIPVAEAVVEPTVVLVTKSEVGMLK